MAEYAQTYINGNDDDHDDESYGKVVEDIDRKIGNDNDSREGALLH